MDRSSGGVPADSAQERDNQKDDDEDHESNPAQSCMSPFSRVRDDPMITVNHAPTHAAICEPKQSGW
jgi:hypothetical protein